MDTGLIDRLPTRPMPGGRWGRYPQRDADRLRGAVHAATGRLRALDGRRGRGFAAAVLEQARSIDGCTPAGGLAERVEALRRRQTAGLAERALHAQALALACVAARRTLGLTPYATQVQAAAVMLDDGLAELATGEGKTLALALAAGSRALAGVPVHVVTVNDYLVERDAAHLAPFYRALGLGCDRVLGSDPPPRRRQAWRRDVVYCTAHELMFDWLRDRLAGADRADLAALAGALAPGAPESRPSPLLQGLCSAFLDEADSLLVDQAVLPCVLAQDVDDGAGGCADALRIAQSLWQGRDWHPEPRTRRARLTELGRERVAAAAAGLEGPWRIARRREEWVAQALAALHLYRADREYLLRDGRVEIIDASTGRVAPGRAWTAGLHQMIEHKERARGTLPHHPVIQVTPARLFRRYWRLGGLSATLAEARGELAAGYGVDVVRIAPRVPSGCTVARPRVLADPLTRQAALIDRVRALTLENRPVLVAVRDVAESTALAAAMRAAGLAPAVIDARHAEAEAAAVATAGQAGRITLATDMAGRGTDIVLDALARRAGGLALVATFAHASRRLERQLHGRVARRGEPGSVEAWLLAGGPRADEVGALHLPPFVGRLPAGIASRLAALWVRVLQGRVAARERRARRRERDAALQRNRRQLIGRIED